MTTIANDPFAAANAATKAAGSAAAAPAAKSDTSATDRFLKLLVTQMQNQDPLNPMDNAQVTSQMAQINTVSGIQDLNTTVKNLDTQYRQMQAVQGAALVGREVTLQGNRLDLKTADGATTGSGGFELAGNADSVKVEVLDGAGHVLGSTDLGAQSAGGHDFTWPPAGRDFDWPATGVTAGDDLRFRVTATRAGAAVATTHLTRDRVEAVSSSAQGLVLETAHQGEVPYADVKAFN